MPTTLQSILATVTADQVKAQLLAGLQGIGPVQQTGQGSGTVVPAGSPLGNYDIIVLVGTGGALGTATFTYSLNGGTTYAGPFTTPATGSFSATGTGMTFTFAGTFNAGDLYSFGTVYPPFPVTNWPSGGAAQTLVQSEAQALADLAGSNIPGIAAGGFVDYAPGLAANPNATNDWLSLLSHETYENDRFQPASTLAIVSLTLAASAANQSFNAGALIVANGLGTAQGIYRFLNTSTVNINAGQTIQVVVQAELPGSAYNLQNNTVTTIQTPKPGLTVNNPAPGTSSVTTSGGATGVLSVSGSPAGNYSVVIKVTTSGALGAGFFQVSLDGGSNYAAPVQLPSSGSYPIPIPGSGGGSTGLTLTVSGTFTSGDSYTFTSYAQWITTPGRDVEGDAALQTRDKNRWPTIAVGAGTSGAWDFLARNTPNGGSEVVKTYSAPDTTTPGQMDLVVAGAAGPVSTAALAAITTRLQGLVGLTSTINVQNSLVFTLALVGTIYVKASQLAAAQTAIGTALAALALATPIQGTVNYSDIVGALNQKASGVTDVHLTTPTPNVDTTVPAQSVVAFNTSGLTYVLQ